MWEFLVQHQKWVQQQLFNKLKSNCYHCGEGKHHPNAMSLQPWEMPELWENWHACKSHKTQHSAKAQYVSGDISETQCAVDDEHEGHTGMIRMKALARGCLWWVGLDKDIQNFICKCSPCELRWNQPPSLLFIHGPGWQHLGIHVDYAEIE